AHVAVPQTMLVASVALPDHISTVDNGTLVPQTMLSSSRARVPHTMLSSSSENIPETTFAKAPVPQTMLSSQAACRRSTTLVPRSSAVPQITVCDPGSITPPKSFHGGAAPISQY